MISFPIAVLIMLGILILIVVIFFLPKNIAARVSALILALGLVFTGLALWLSASTEDRRIKEKDIEKSNEYWMNVFKTFIETPSLAPMYQKIYGTDIPVNEHAMFSIMMQEVEAIVAAAGTMPISDSWENTIRRWISHPSFPLYWEQNKDQYSEETEDYINFLLKKKYPMIRI